MGGAVLEGRTRFWIYILMVKSKGFPNGLNVGCERKDVRDLRITSLNARRVELWSSEMGQTVPPGGDQGLGVELVSLN